MRNGRVVYNSDTMEFGVVRKRLPDKTGVCPLDPITHEENWKSWTEGTKGWKAVPNGHLVQKWVDFFDIVEDADWYITGGCNEIDEHSIEDQDEVFKQIRKLFGF